MTYCDNFLHYKSNNNFLQITENQLIKLFIQIKIVKINYFFLSILFSFFYFFFKKTCFYPINHQFLNRKALIGMIKAFLFNP